MNKRTLNIRRFYEQESSLVSSPFITQFNEVNEPLFRRVFRKLGLEPKAEATVLDVGCGRGLLATHFSQGFYLGVDLAVQPTVKPLLSERRAFVQGDSHHLPVKSRSIDLLICLDSFEHYPRMESAAAEFRRVLKDDGVLFLSIPNYSNVAGMVKRFLEENRRVEPSSWAPFDFWKQQELEQFITPARVRGIFRRAGFRRFRYIGHADELIIGLFPWLWHPQMPQRVAHAAMRLYAPLSRPLTALAPFLSLHTFWKIEP